MTAFSRNSFTAALLLLCCTAVAAGEEELVLSDVITYIRSPLAEQRTVISEEELQRAHSEGLASLLESYGFQLLSYGAYGLEAKPQIRGFTDETVRVVVDGVCVNNAQYGTFDFSSISIDDIERIEVVRGGFTEGVTDDGSVGGVIYITTKRQALGTSLYSDSSAKTFFNPSSPVDAVSESAGLSTELGGASFLRVGLSGTLAANRYFYTDYEGQLSECENSSVKDLKADAAFATFYGQGSSLFVSDGFYLGSKQTPGTKNSLNYGDQEDLNNRLLLRMTSPALLGCIRMENTAAYLFDRRFFTDSYGPSVHYIHTLKYSFTGELYKYDRWNQTAGLSADLVFLDSSNDGNHFLLNLRLKETAKISLTDHLSVSVPLGLELSGRNFAFLPKIGLRAAFSHIDLMLGAYRMVQFPNMDDLYWQGSGATGNPDLKPEKGWGAELSVNVKEVAFPFSASVFVNYYSSKIQWNTSLAPMRPDNIASAFYAGLDFSFKKSFWMEHIRMRGSLEYLYNCLLDSTNEYTYGKRIMLTPDLTASLGVDFSYGDFSAALSASYVGPRYTSNLNVRALGCYVILNAGAEYKIGSRFTPYIKGENLLNWEYESVEGYSVPGLSIKIGGRLNF